MKLSEQPEYLVAIPAKLEGNFTLARKNLQVLVARAEDQGDIRALGYLLQTLGDCEAHDGNHQRGAELHQKAISLDPNSPMPYLFYAQGLFRAFGNRDASLAMLSEAEQVLAMSQCDEDEMPKSYYEREFQILKDEISNAG